MTSAKSWSKALTAAVLAFGCAKSGEPRAGTDTGNPVMDEPDSPPPYESPIDFNPNDEGPPGCPGPSDDTTPTRGPYAQVAGNLVVGVDRPHGLFAVDVSDLRTPELRGSLPLGGYAVAAHEENVAVLTEEWPEVPTDELPSPSELDASTLRLVHVDVSDPDNLRRVGHVDLEGEPWRTFERDGVVWSMRATLAEREPSCNFPWQGCYYPARVGLVVEGYRFTPSGFEQVEAITLPMRQRAWAGRDGFVTATSMWDGEEDQPTGMVAAHFEGDGLAVSEFAGELGPAYLTPVGVEGNLLYFFTGTETFTLHVMDIGSAEMVQLAEVPGLPQPRPQSVHFSPNRVIVSAVEPTASGVVVDLTDPSSPTLKPLPTGVAMALPLDETRLLGWGDPGSGTWSVGVVENGVFGQVANTAFASESFVQDSQPFYVPNMVVAQDHVAFSAREYDGSDVRNVLVSLDTTTDPIAVEQSDAHAEEVFASDGGWVTSDWGGVSTTAFDGTTGSVDFGYENTEDVTLVGNRVASLSFGLDGVSQVVVAERDGTERGRVDVPGSARSLSSVNGWVVVVLADEGSECEQSGGLECDERGLWIIDTEDPAVVGRVAFPTVAMSNLSDRVSVEQYVRAPLKLQSGEWVTAIERGITCSFVADCEALGIEARPLADAGIVPDSLAPCPENVTCPEPPPPPEVHGTRGELALVRLDVNDAGEPQLVELGKSVLELQDSSFGDLVAAGGEVLVTRRELQRQPGQPWNGGVARFMIERFAIDGSTASKPPEPPEPVNVPGYAAGVGDDGSLFTIEPGTDETTAATLYRLRITEQGAYVEASRSFEGRYGDIHVNDGYAYYVGKGSDGCGMGLLQPIALDDELTLLDSVDLPGSEWSIVDASKDELLLGGPYYSGVALFDTIDGDVQLLGYFRASPELARLFDGEVWTAAGRLGVQTFTPQ